MVLTQIAPRELAAMLADKEQAPWILDVRSSAEVAQWAFPGAYHLPMHLVPLKLEELPRDRPIVVICLSGARSAQVAYYLMQQGFDKVYNLAGGVSAWLREMEQSRG